MTDDDLHNRTRRDGGERRTTIELVAVSLEGLRGAPAHISFSWT